MVASGDPLLHGVGGEAGECSKGCGRGDSEFSVLEQRGGPGERRCDDSVRGWASAAPPTSTISM